MLIRELKYYRWISDGKYLIIVDKKAKTKIPLSKVYAKSLTKFGIDHLDRMRIEENKTFREKIRALKKQVRERVARLKEQLREAKQRNT